MGPKHDTRAALEPVGGVTLCAHHHETIKDIYDAVERGCNSKMSKSQTMWVIGVLMVVAGSFGALLWQNTASATGEISRNFNEIDRRVLTLEVQWKTVQQQLDRIETEQRALRQEASAMRTENNTQLEGIRRLVKESKSP